MKGLVIFISVLSMIGAFIWLYHTQSNWALMLVILSFPGFCMGVLEALEDLKNDDTPSMFG